jgi:hypothetical protein
MGPVPPEAQGRPEGRLIAGADGYIVTTAGEGVNAEGGRSCAVVPP